MKLDEFSTYKEYFIICSMIANDLELKIVEEGDVIVARFKENNEIAFLSRDIKIMYKALMSLI